MSVLFVVHFLKGTFELGKTSIKFGGKDCLGIKWKKKCPIPLRIGVSCKRKDRGMGL